MYKFAVDVTRSNLSRKRLEVKLHAPVVEAYLPYISYYTCRVDIATVSNIPPFRGATPLDALENAIGFVRIFLSGGNSEVNRIDWL